MNWVVFSTKGLLRVLAALFFVLFIHSAHRLFSFCSHIFLQNCFDSFVSGCWYAFVHSTPYMWSNFITLFWRVLFCLYVFQISVSFLYLFLRLYLLIYLVVLHRFFNCCVFPFSVPSYSRVFPCLNIFALLLLSLFAKFSNQPKMRVFHWSLVT